LVGLGLAVSLGISTAGLAQQPAYIQSVPDWNVPRIADGNLADPGPVALVALPPNGVPNGWCTPTASANIMGYYRDTVLGLSIADQPVFPITTLRPSVDWRDDTLDTLTAPPAPNRQDIGWYMNTNSIGNGAMPLSPGGTLYGNVQPGLVSYFAAYNLNNVSVVNYTDPNNANASPFDNSGVPGAQRNLANAYTRLQGEVDNLRPALLHILYWSLLNRAQVRVSGIPNLPDYDFAQWGAPVGNSPDYGDYTPEIGHTVTIVGYWNGGLGLVPGDPFSGLGNGGSTPDALIVYDNSDGTLAAPTRSLPLVVPFSSGQGLAGLNVPWVMQTEISGVPEPATLGLLALGGLGVLLRRKK
jgi:hypothetical protein